MDPRYAASGGWVEIARSAQAGQGPATGLSYALVSSIGATLPVAADLTLRATHLQAVIPKLRAKGAADAVALFLTKDALLPSVALADPTTGVGMSDRAARRLCDRLVDLAVVRELIGRDTFRLYGV